MRATLLMVLGAIVPLLMTVGDARAEITPQQVRQAIDDAVAYLKQKQRRDLGDWPGFEGQPGGVTALCTLALLNAGVPPDDPAIRQSLRYLQNLVQPADSAMTYSVSLQIMAFCAADPDRYRPFINRSARWLENIQIRDGERRGSWGYSATNGSGDKSNTQFAMLALHEAERVGVKIDPQTWRLALGYWLRTQKEDGSWGYRDGPSTGSMTCAGVASIIIASGKLSTQDAQVVDGNVMCCREQADDDPAKRGLDWMARRFSVRSNPNSLGNPGLTGQTWLFYYLYGVERVGRLTGNRFIGNHDWYREGAEFLVETQDSLTRSWKGYGHAEDDPVIATSLALLFLSKGRRPVVIAKLKHGDPNQALDSAAGRDWDHHRQSVQNLTRSIEKKWKRDLTWQTIDGHVATVDDLLQTPVLFISGRDQLQMSSEQRENLREYVARGGFIFAEACCGGKAFDQSFRELMKEIFPNSPLRLLPADHAVWFAEAKVDPKYMRPLYGIEACCRTSIVYCPSDLSCYWELSQPERDSDYPPGVQEEIDACVQIGQNVVAYATNRILKDKLERPHHSRDPLQEQLARGMLYIPKLDHEGGADDAPNSLSNLLRFVGEKVEMRVSPNHLMLEPTDPGIFDFPILFMHGRREFQLPSAQRKALATYLQRGGLIIADSICANEQFSQSFRREMEAVLPGRRFERISPDHPMFSQQFGGFDLSTVTLRDPLLRADEGDPLEARLTRINPLLEGITLDDRLAVIFSPYDLSCGLENHASLECKGYISADAAKIGLNLILFGLQQ